MHPSHAASPRRGRVLLVLLAVVVLGAAAAAFGYWKLSGSARPAPAASAAAPAPARPAKGRYADYGRLRLWWDQVPASARKEALDTGGYSNIEPEDYVGADQCGRCHATQHKAWAQHPHRWMNAA